MWDPLGAGDSNLIIRTTMNDFGALVERLEDECISGSDWSPIQGMNFFRLFYHIDIQSIIYFVDTDGKFIVSAGLDPEIKVWNTDDGKFVRELTGHTASVTGLKILGQGLKEQADRTVLSSSKDGTIRQWSLKQGQEMRRITTSYPLTCMGIPNFTLVATGNIRGCLEVYHLVTGKRFTGVVAHTKSIDALIVNGNYICTAVYGPPSSSLNLWMLKWGKLICTYRLEQQYPIQYSTFTFLNENILVLGENNRLALHAINIATAEKQCKEINKAEGHVQHIEALLDILLVSTINLDGVVQLHLYLQEGFDHLATFYCKGMERISSMRMVKEYGSMKIILGGSSLAILQLGDSENNSCLEELKYRCRQAQKMAVEKNTMSGYFSEKEETCPEYRKYSGNINSKSLQSNPNSTDEKMKDLSLLSNVEECRYPMKQGKVRLPPIDNSKEPITRNKVTNSEMTSTGNETIEVLESDTKLENASTSKVDVNENSNESGVNQHGLGNQNRENEAILEVSQTYNSPVIEPEYQNSDDGFILNPLSVEDDDDSTEIDYTQGGFKMNAKKKQKSDGSKADGNGKKRCSIM